MNNCWRGSPAEIAGRLLRKMDERDLLVDAENKVRARQAEIKCKELIRQHVPRADPQPPAVPQGNSPFLAEGWQLSRLRSAGDVTGAPYIGLADDAGRALMEEPVLRPGSRDGDPESAGAV